MRRDAVDVPVTICPPSSSPAFSARSRLMRRPGVPVPERGLGAGLVGDVDREDGFLNRRGFTAVAVRQAPSQAIEEPMAIEAAG